jgi:hypothetical protein
MFAPEKFVFKYDKGAVINKFYLIDEEGASESSRESGEESSESEATPPPPCEEAQATAECSIR